MRNADLLSHVRGAVAGMIVWSVAGPSVAEVGWLPIAITWMLASTAAGIVAMLCLQALFAFARRCLLDLRKPLDG